MSQGVLDLDINAAHAGFRLQRFELFNWGTFHDRVWTLECGGDNVLVTGEIGAGKSTLVDAISTLLVAPQRITYNKAAGAEARERTLRSYVEGHFKSERNEQSSTARAVALRDQKSFSVLLGYFYNEGFERHVTLAVVLWFKDGAGQPERFYLAADAPLSIAEHFGGFGKDINALRRRLREMPEVKLFESFNAYEQDFRRRFGLDSKLALELFNQTVSMKSVGNLTDFVRTHMLEAFDLESKRAALVSHFDDLSRAHQAILQAKAQVSVLSPLVDDGAAHREVASVSAGLRECRDALRPWFAGLKSALLYKRGKRLEADLERCQARIGSLGEQRARLLGDRDRLMSDIAANGGDRLERIRIEIADQSRLRDERLQRAEQYAGFVRALDLPVPQAESGAATFSDNRQSVLKLRMDSETRAAHCQNDLTEAGVDMHTLKSTHHDTQQELESLRQRRTNIPARMLALRERLCEGIGVATEAVPFAGELVAVRDEEQDWVGAAERLLHNFALSLVVDSAHYAKVSAWVDRTHLRGRLVYFRVDVDVAYRVGRLHPQSLVRKLLIKPDSPFYAWLEAELARRFNYVCCTDLAAFRREKSALTRAGQIKSAAGRHEKDDRHDIDDRTRFVLGWDNAAKLQALQGQVEGLQRRMQDLGAQIAGIQSDLARQRQRLDWCARVEVFTSHAEIDWSPLAVRIDALEKERAKLSADSDILAQLQDRLTALEAEQRNNDLALTAATREEASTQTRLEQTHDAFAEARETRASATDAMRERCYPRLKAMRDEALGEHRLTVESCDNRQSEMREWLQHRIDSEERRLARLRDRIIDAMRRYQGEFPLHTREVDVSIEALPEYESMLQALQRDDLPRFEDRFKRLLNENTIREVAAFQAELHRERLTIGERIAEINESLHEIDYNPGRYIELVAETSVDAEVREFQAALRSCTEGALSGSDSEQYSEVKFLAVKAIIERFRGREGHTDIDRRWTRKVTDVRNWFVFAASERWREDQSEYEHYADSAGKSGGQKEKLAYTVLAASLAYQFGIHWGETRSRSFRFVVIDEAFGRGSDESAHYGLELFQKLNLQLLVVTPLQKIHIIEPFVSSVGFVHSADGREAMLRNLTIEEYRAERAARQMIRTTAAPVGQG